MTGRLAELVAESVAELVPGADAERGVAQRLAEYGALVQRYGARVNLVGDRSDAFVARNLIGGSLQLLRVARPTGRLVDVGSGAGVPGLVLALACQGLAVTLVEVRQKRAAFLRRAVSLLGLQGVVVIDDRDVSEVQGPFEWAVARAFKPPADWLPIGARLVGERGRIGLYTTRALWRATAPGGLAPGLRVVGEAADSSGPGRVVVVLEKGKGGADIEVGV